MGGWQEAAQGRFQLGPEMFDRIEIGRVSGQEEQFAARVGHQFLRAGRVVETGVVQDNHAAFGQCRQQNLFKVGVHHLRVATALEDKGSHQPGVLRHGNDAGAVAAAPRHFDIKPLPARRAAIFLMQPVLHAAFVQVKNFPARQGFELPPKQPPLHLISFAIFYEFFLA